MDKVTPDLVLDAPPEAATIRQLREQAQEQASSFITVFEPPSGSHLLVVSDRGTCVLLKDGTSVQTWNREVDEETIAADVQEAV